MKKKYNTPTIMVVFVRANLMQSASVGMYGNYNGTSEIESRRNDFFDDYDEDDEDDE